MAFSKKKKPAHWRALSTTHNTALGGRSGLALDAALDLDRLAWKFSVWRVQKEGIQPTLEIDSALCGRGQSQTNHLTQCLAQQRRCLYIRQKTPTGFVVGVAHVIPSENAFTGDHATSCH